MSERIPEPMFADEAPWLSPAQVALADYMAELSEDCYCAGWLHGLDEALWSFVESGEPGQWGIGTVTAEDIAALRRLSEACGGWLRWDDAIGGPLFVAAEAWRSGRGSRSPEGTETP